MKEAIQRRKRLSIDVLPEERQQIKVHAVLHGMTIRRYVLECIQEQLRRETEEKDLSAMTSYPSSALQELWDNEKDARYDAM